MLPDSVARIACRQPGKLFFHILGEFVLRVLFRLIDLAALGHQPGL